MFKIDFIKNKTSFLYLLLIILGAFILRIAFLTSENLWFDEFYSIKTSLALPYSLVGMNFLKTAGPVPVFYFFILKVWITIFGYSALSVRLLSVLPSIATIVLIFLLGAKLFNKQTGILAAFLLSICPAHLFYSQEARQYMLYLFFTLIVYYVFVQCLFDRKKHLLILGALLLLLMNTHFFGVFIVLALIVSCLFAEKDKALKIKWVRFIVLLGVVFASVVFVIYRDIFSVAARVSWISPKTIGGSFVYLFHFFSYGGGQLGGEDFKLVIPFLTKHLYPYVLLALFIIGARYAYIKKQLALAVILPWIFVPFLSIILISSLYMPALLGRHILNLIPAYFLIIAYALSCLIEKNKILFLIIIGIIIILLVPALHAYYYQEKRMPISCVVKQLSKEFETGELIFILPSWARAHSIFYLNKQYALGHTGCDISSTERIEVSKIVQGISQLERYERNELLELFPGNNSKEVPEKLYLTVNERRLLKYFKANDKRYYPKKIYFINIDWYDIRYSKLAKQILEYYLPKYYHPIREQKWKRVTLTVYVLND